MHPEFWLNLFRRQRPLTTFVRDQLLKSRRRSAKRRKRNVTSESARSCAIARSAAGTARQTSCSPSQPLRSFVQKQSEIPIGPSELGTTKPPCRGRSDFRQSRLHRPFTGRGQGPSASAGRAPSDERTTKPPSFTVSRKNRFSKVIAKDANSLVSW